MMKIQFSVEAVMENHKTLDELFNLGCLEEMDLKIIYKQRIILCLS